MDELGEELLEGAEGGRRSGPMNQIGKETPYGTLTKASSRVVDA